MRKRPSRRSRGIGGLLAIGLASWFLADAALAEIYRWVDEAGRVHFTADLHQVPVAQRRAAESAAKAPAGRSPVQVYDAPAARSRTGATGSRASRQTAARVHRIRVQSAGGSMRVKVRINDRLDVPFLIDTGATDVVLPQWAADELGLDLSEARTGTYATANGVITQKLVQLESVSLAGAEVEEVPATVSPSMREGLLGLSYFNHFKYDVDPVKGIVTLQPNDLAETGVLRGGRSRAQWRQHFAAARARIRHAEARLDEVSFGRSRQRDEVVEQIAALERELSLLESDADDARVPFDWRD